MKKPVLDIIDGKAGVCGLGVNDADYPVRVNSKMCPYYVLWTSMFHRCYSDYYHSKKPQYKECSVDPVWFSFMAFRSWVIKQGPSLYDVDGNRLEIDKDLIDPSNKIYSPDRCCLVSKKVNSFLSVFRGKGNSTYPGVFYDESRTKYKASCHDPFGNRPTHIGRFDSEVEAYMAWLKRKQEYAHLLADSKYVTTKKVRKHLKAHFHLDRFTSMATKTKKTSTKKKKKPILDVIDGHNWLHRAYFAAPPLTTADGIPTGAAKAFINMLNKVIASRIEERGVCYMAVAFDSPSRNGVRRKRMAEFLKANKQHLHLLPAKFLKGYKGTREDPEGRKEDLKPQFAIAKKFLDARGIVHFEEDGAEADDIIGTLATNSMIRTMVQSKDKDFAQLLSPKVRITQPGQGKLPEVKLTYHNCLEYYGVSPDVFVDYLALCGDSADNIPGIPGVGHKIAVELLSEHSDIDGIIEAAAAKKIKGKLGEKLSTKFYVDLLLLCRELAEIDKDLDIETDYKKFKLRELNAFRKKLDVVAKRYEFKSHFTA